MISSLKEGIILKGEKERYRIVKEIGSGGFGITYLAEQTYYSQQIGESSVSRWRPFSQPDIVVIKEIFYSLDGYCKRGANTTTVEITGGDKEETIWESFKRRFIEEGKTLAKFQHEHIVTVTDNFLENNTVYTVLEYIEGDNLKNLVQKDEVKDAALYLGYMRDALQGLKVLHANRVYHFDIKPDNIMVNNQGDVKIIDFGSSMAYKTDGKADYSVTGISKVLRVQGVSKGYCPNEVEAGLQDYGDLNQNVALPVSIDLYGIGATLYYCVTGQSPPWASRLVNGQHTLFDHEGAALPAPVKAIIVKALSVKYFDRYQDAEDMLKDINAALKSLSAAKKSGKTNAVKNEANGVEVVTILPADIDSRLNIGLTPENDSRLTIPVNPRDSDETQINDNRVTSKLKTIKADLEKLQNQSPPIGDAFKEGFWLDRKDRVSLIGEEVSALSKRATAAQRKALEAIESDCLSELDNIENELSKLKSKPARKTSPRVKQETNNTSNTAVAPKKVPVKTVKPYTENTLLPVSVAESNTSNKKYFTYAVVSVIVGALLTYFVINKSKQSDASLAKIDTSATLKADSGSAVKNNKDTVVGSTLTSESSKQITQLKQFNLKQPKGQIPASAPAVDAQSSNDPIDLLNIKNDVNGNINDFYTRFNETYDIVVRLKDFNQQALKTCTDAKNANRPDLKQYIKQYTDVSDNLVSELQHKWETLKPYLDRVDALPGYVRRKKIPDNDRFFIDVSKRVAECDKKANDAGDLEDSAGALRKQLADL